MMDTPNMIHSLIEEALHPKHIQVVDLSHQHRHHTQAPKGQGHYHLIISPDAFNTTNRITQHRKIYELLGPLMKTRIHAMKITVTQSD